MRILFHSRTRLPGKRRLLAFAQNICKDVRPLNRKGEIGVRFVSDPEIRKINKKFLRHPWATDVISFSYPPQRAEKDDAPFGDLTISLDTARRQARRGGHETLQEIALLLAHGLLHLAGEKDDTPSRQKKMFARQTRLFRRWDPALAPPDFK